MQQYPIDELLLRIANQLNPGAPLYATFGSTHDARYRMGEEIEPRVYAPIDGDERGVPHTFFDEPRLRALVGRHFHIESLAEVKVDDIAGTWAHKEQPLESAVHWFLVAVKR